jgi:hypothetical protein
MPGILPPPGLANFKKMANFKNILAIPMILLEANFAGLNFRSFSDYTWYNL